MKKFDDSKKIIIATVCGVMILAAPVANAFYPVFDAKNVAEAVKILEEMKKQYDKLNEQINIAKAQLQAHRKELTDLPRGVLNDFKKMADEATGIVHDTIAKNTGFLKDIKGDVKDIRAEILKIKKETFAKAGCFGIDLKDVDKKTADSLNAQTDANVQKVNDDTLVTIAALEKSIDEDLKTLAKLEEMNKTVEGVKDAQQLANLISIVTTQIEAKTAKIEALKAKKEVIADTAERTKAANNEIAKLNEALEADKKYKTDPWKDWEYKEGTPAEQTAKSGKATQAKFNTMWQKMLEKK